MSYLLAKAVNTTNKQHKNICVDVRAADCYDCHASGDEDRTNLSDPAHLEKIFRKCPKTFGLGHTLLCPLLWRVKSFYLLITSSVG